MDDNTPTTPLPPAQEPQPAYASQPAYAPQAQAQPHHPVDEPFYKRYGLAFAISTLVLGSFVVLAFIGGSALVVGTLVSHSNIVHVLEQGKNSQHFAHPGQGYGGQGKGNGQGQGNGAGQGNGSGQGNGNAPGQGQGTLPGNLVVVRGAIASISGSTWTITAQNGNSETVQLTSSTRFGGPNQSAGASDFVVGEQVIVLGSRSNGTVTASRVLELSNLKQPGPITPGVPSTPSPTP